MVVAAAGVPLAEIQAAAFSNSRDMHALIARAYANLSSELGKA
jgi:hypothetical protein